jgi:hypothetical protein
MGHLKARVWNSTKGWFDCEEAVSFPGGCRSDRCLAFGHDWLSGQRHDHAHAGWHGQCPVTRLAHVSLKHQPSRPSKDGRLFVLDGSKDMAPRLWLSVLLTCLALTLFSGCGGERDKGANKGLDRPRSTRAG